MTGEQTSIVLILILTVAMFIWGRWRYDMVAVAAMIACVVTGLVKPSDAYLGFAHPAVVTVACVLILSKGLQNTGAVDMVAKRVLPANASIAAGIFGLTGLAAALSGFMNNVGALALTMPVALQFARRKGLAPGRTLMPLAFGSILGGTTTLIGTPPNLIVAGFRAETGAAPFAMFDFTPAGGAITLVGVAFIALVGWRLVPNRDAKGAATLVIGNYLTEVCVGDESPLAGKTVGDAERALASADAQIVSLIHADVEVAAITAEQVICADDRLVIEADPRTVMGVLDDLGLSLPESSQCILTAGDGRASDIAAVTGRTMVEVVALQGSGLIGRTAAEIGLRETHGLNLLAISHRGESSIRRLQTRQFAVGDVLVLHGTPEAAIEFAATYGCAPLMARASVMPNRRLAVLAAGIMACAMGLAAIGAMPASITFAGAVVLYMALRIAPLRTVYESVDWPVVILLGAMIPVAGAMASTGAADVLARLLQENVAHGNPVVGLVVIMAATMLLTDTMNNAATAAVMCPVAIRTAAQLQVSDDPFLMAVGIGASCAFLTPIGHQNNTLILGPGGFRFADYWRMGLPLDILVIGVAVPVLLRVWPL